MNEISPELAAREVLPEHRIAGPRALSPDEAVAVAAGTAITLALGALQSHAEINRNIRVDRIYRK